MCVWVMRVRSASGFNRLLLVGAAARNDYIVIFVIRFVPDPPSLARRQRPRRLSDLSVHARRTRPLKRRSERNIHGGING
jgi:hypothetical protein